MKHAWCVALMVGWLGFAPIARAFQDPLQTAAVPSRLAATSHLTAVAQAGEHLVAVGRRGTIVVSDDKGARWTQVKVPVSCDLVAVHFPTARTGWAVGHDGVILRSTDGGASWTKQSDGVALAQTALAFYHAKMNGGDKAAAEHRKLAEDLVADGADKPLLSVWFKNEQVGFVSGAFGLLFKTVDAGATWEPWMHRIDNPKGLHLYSIQGDAKGVVIAGEQGLLASLSEPADRFRALTTPYAGSFFGVALRGNSVLVHGMRGNAYLSTDRGVHWRRLTIPSMAGLNASAFDDDGEILIATQTGDVLVSRSQGESFSVHRASRPVPYFGMALFGHRRTALVGLAGVGLETWH